MFVISKTVTKILTFFLLISKARLLKLYQRNILYFFNVSESKSRGKRSKPSLEDTLLVKSDRNKMAAASHLEVDVSAAVAGKARPLQRHHLLLVGVADGEARQARVPVLVDVADGGAWWSLDLQLSRNTEEEEEYKSLVIMDHVT